MIDTFALALTHGLLLLAAWRLFRRDDLDTDDPGRARRAWGRKPDA
ncbi:MAG TPA: hypothetical protein VFL92_08955 [Sphingomonas sp.]|nr:hypothetical protein [Sphingomonas sp.]